MNQKKTYLRKLPEIIVLLFCMILLGLGVSRKEGFHMDELLSFELSNAEFNPWIVPTQPEGRLAKFVRNEIDGETFGETLGNLADTVTDVLQNRGSSKLLSYKADVYEEPVWITGQQFSDYLTVDEKDDFQYLSVYFNVKDDNHPPVHFMLLHTMSSLFRNLPFTFLGCFINMAAVAVAMVYLMKIGRLFANILGMEKYGRFAGLFAALLYGCSTGALASVLLIRMYCVMSAFCVGLFYIHLKKWNEKGFGKKNGGLIALTVLGFLTQYFFLFYCLMLAAVTAVLLFAEKRGKELWCYIRSMVLAAVIGVACFPFAVQDVFSSGRGVEALENLSAGFAGYGSRISTFGRILLGRTIGNNLFVVLGFIVLVEAVVFVWKRLGKAEKQNARQDVPQRRTLKESGAGAWLMLLLPVISYFLLAARMSPYLVDRYIMPVFPFVMVAVSVSVVWFGGILEKRWVVYAVCGILFALQIGGWFSYDGTYLYQGYEGQRETAQAYAEYPCICVYDGVGYYENLLEFTAYEKTLLVTEAELSGRRDTESVSELEHVVVLVKQNVNVQNVCTILIERYGLEMQEELHIESVYGDKLLLFGGKGSCRIIP